MKLLKILITLCLKASMLVMWLIMTPFFLILLLMYPFFIWLDYYVHYDCDADEDYDNFAEYVIEAGMARCLIDMWVDYFKDIFKTK